MIIRNNRIIFSDNGVLKDLSHELNDFSQSSEVLPIVSAQDAIYIGSTLPFNARYIQVKVANSNVANMNIYLWDGKEFTIAVDVLDQTKDVATKTKTLSQSGMVSWEKLKTQNWRLDDTERVTGLTSLRIYDLYWAKITFSADLSLTTELSFIGQKFSEDADLAMMYPDLNQSVVKAQFQTGKTTWDDQHLLAADRIVYDVASQDYLFDANQILRWDVFKEASIHKVAEIIFNSQGDDNKDNRERARAYYNEALNLINAYIDLNKNIHLDSNEVNSTFSVKRR